MSKRGLAFLAAVTLATSVGCAGEPGPESRRGGAAGSVQEGFVEVETGLRLYYRVVGDGQQSVIVPAGFYLENLLDRLADGRTLIFYDMRDRGRSDSVADASRVGIQQDIDDLEALRAHFDLEKMSLIGWSYLGAMIAMYAIQHPERIERLVQIGPAPPRAGAPYQEAAMQAYLQALDPAGLERLEELAAAGVRENEPERFYEEFWRVHKPALFGDRSKAAWYDLPPADLPNEWLHNLEPHFQAKLASLGDYDLREAAARLKVPVLTIHGKLDRNAPFEGGREWSAAFADGGLLAVEGSAHMPMVEQPSLIHTAIDVFLRGYWPEGTQRISSSSRDR